MYGTGKDGALARAYVQRIIGPEEMVLQSVSMAGADDTAERLLLGIEVAAVEEQLVSQSVVVGSTDGRSFGDMRGARLLRMCSNSHICPVCCPLSLVSRWSFIF